jgi:hypothetical protein
LDDSILDSIKKILGMPPDYDAFDTDLVIHINSVFGILAQLGVGPAGGFSISDNTTLWKAYLGDSKDLEMVKSYIALKVRLVFDPPTIGAVMDAMKEQIREYEWRLNVQVDH